MKILIVQDFLRSGGTERQSVLLANAFAAAGLEVMLVTFRPSGPLAVGVSGTVRHRSLQPFDLRLDWFAPGLHATVRDFAPQVVLCMGRMANCYGETMQDALRSVRPRGVVIGTMRTGKTLPRLFRRSLLAVRHVVANSRDAADTLVREYHVPREKISVIYNSLVFPETLSAEQTVGRRTTVRHEHGAAAATFVLLCVAMFRPEKNQRELIEIMAELPRTLDWQLWFAGDGPARELCGELARARGVSERVKFLGFHRDPSGLYAAADAAVHASESEALSNFLIEAQAHGIPAVAYAAQGISECFVPGETGWEIARDDRPGFRAALLQLRSESSEQKERRSAKARAFARTAFDPARQVAAYLELFERLA